MFFVHKVPNCTDYNCSISSRTTRFLSVNLLWYSQSAQLTGYSITALSSLVPLEMRLPYSSSDCCSKYLIFAIGYRQIKVTHTLTMLVPLNVKVFSASQTLFVLQGKHRLRSRRLEHRRDRCTATGQICDVGIGQSVVAGRSSSPSTTPPPIKGCCSD